MIGFDSRQGFENKLKAAGAEMSDLEELGRIVQEDNGDDAGLTTEVRPVVLFFASKGLRGWWLWPR